MAESKPTTCKDEVRRHMEEKHPENEYERLPDLRTSFLKNGPSFNSVMKNIDGHLSQCDSQKRKEAETIDSMSSPNGEIERDYRQKKLDLLQLASEQFAEVKEAFQYNPQEIEAVLGNIRSSLETLSSISDTTECNTFVRYLEKDIQGVVKVTSDLLSCCESRFSTLNDYVCGLEEQEKEIFANMADNLSDNMIKLRDIVMTIEKSSKQLTEVLYSALAEVKKGTGLIEAYSTELRNIDCCLCDNIGPEVHRRSEWNTTDKYLQAFLENMEQEENQARAQSIEAVPEDIKALLPAEVANLLLINDFTPSTECLDDYSRAFCDDLDSMSNAIMDSSACIQDLITESFANYAPESIVSESRDLQSQISAASTEKTEIEHSNKKEAEQLKNFKSEKEKAIVASRKTVEKLKLEQKQRNELVVEINTLRDRASKLDKEIKDITECTKRTQEDHNKARKEHQAEVLKLNESYKSLNKKFDEIKRSYFNTINEIKTHEKLKEEGKKTELVMHSLKKMQELLMKDIERFKKEIKSLEENKTKLVKRLEA